MSDVYQPIQDSKVVLRTMKKIWIGWSDTNSL